MKYFLVFLLLVFASAFNNSIGQDVKISKDVLREKIELWNLSFNKHDTINFFNLLDSGIAFAAGGGTDVGISAVEETVRGLYRNRQNITMNMIAEKIEISEWPIGYDTGAWTETWIEKNNSTKSEIKGNYWRMWKIENNKFKVMAVILTPMKWKK